MENLFVKTMMKLQENKRKENKNTLLKEALNDDKEINSIEDVDGYEADIVTVVDPDLSTEEFNDRQEEINKLIDNTPEGEEVVDTEYVGQHIYTCPLCLTNFYSETEMAEDQKCPICFETPTQFIYQGVVEQDLNDQDEEDLKAAADAVDKPEAEEGQEDIPSEVSEPAPMNEPEAEEVPEEESTEEEEPLTASKKVNTNGKVLGENLTEDEDEEGSLKPIAYLSLTNTMSMEIVEIDTNEDEVKFRYNYGDGRYSEVKESTLEYDEEGRPFFKSYSDEDGNSEEWYIDEFMRANFGESLKTESKNLNENLQVGGSLFFKVKNNIIETQITNVYVDDFNNKTYIQYSDSEGKRSGTMDSEEILKGLEEGTITSENPVPQEVQKPVEMAPAEEPTETSEPVEVAESKQLKETFEEGNSNFTLQIDCSGAAFEGDPVSEVQRILTEVAENLTYDSGRSIMDVNGNKCGFYGFGFEGVTESKAVEDALEKGMDNWNERGDITVAGVKMTKAEFDELETLDELIDQKGNMAIAGMKISEPVKKVLQKFNVL